MHADGHIDWREVKKLLLASYRLVALKRMLAVLEGQRVAISTNYCTAPTHLRASKVPLPRRRSDHHVLDGRADLSATLPHIRPPWRFGPAGREELLRAIRSQSSLALQYWFGASEITVWHWRKAFDIPRLGMEGPQLLLQGARGDRAAKVGEKKLSRALVKRRIEIRGEHRVKALGQERDGSKRR
jgi:hypothetical protein